MCASAGRWSGGCDGGGYWGCKAAVWSVVYLEREAARQAGREGGYVRNRETWRGIRRWQWRGGLTLERSETPAYSLWLSPGQPTLWHPVEGPTARRLLPWQPDQLPWWLLCVKDQSVGHGPRGLVRTAVLVPLDHYCAQMYSQHQLYQNMTHLTHNNNNIYKTFH